MRISPRRIALLSVASLAITATCVDSPTGPRGKGPATFAISPVFSQSATFAKALYASAGLEIDHVRLVITRPPSEVVKDTTVAYDGTGELALDLNIIGPVGEQLTVRLDYVSGSVVLYSGTAQVTTVSPLTPSEQVPQATIVIDPVGPGFDAASVTINPSSGNFSTASAIAFSAKAFTSAPAEIAGALFAWSVDDETVGTVDAAGLLTPTTKGGPIKVKATALSGVFAEASITLKPPAVSIALVSGGGQTAVTGTQLTQIVVKVADVNGNGVAGELVTFAVATGGGAIVVNNGTTDASGLARVTWTLGAAVGSQSITATRAGLTGSPLTVTATATGATKLGFTVEPSTVIAGATISPAVKVAAQDAGGNTITSFTGTVTVALVSNPGSGTLGGTLSATAVAGVATFSNLSVSVAANGYTLSASASGLTSATSAAFNATPGTPAALEFVVQPSNTTQNAAISPPIQVRIKNSFGATVNNATNIVTIAIGTNPGGSTLGGNPNAAAVFGIASFSTLTLNNIANGYTLTASATGLTGTTSTVFNIVPPPTATRTWTGAFSTSWADVSNWNPGGVPSVSDSVVIAAGTSFSPTISSNTSVRSIVVQTGAVLNVGSIQLQTSIGSIANEGSLNLTGSTVTTNGLTNTGSILALGGVTVAGPITNATDGTLTIQGQGSPGAAAFAAVFPITNAGTIQLTDVGASYGAAFAAASLLTNTASGTITTLQGAGGQRTISGPVDNQGTILIAGVQGATFVHTDVSSTNSGTLGVTGGSLTITQVGTTPSFTNTGTITVGNGRTLAIANGAASFLSGSVSGSGGQLFLTGVSVAMNTASMTVPLSTNAATTIVGGTLTIPSGQELVLFSSTFSSSIVLQGTLTARRTNSITGAFSNATGSVLRALGISSSGDLTIANGFTNNGTIQLTDSLASYGASLTITSGTLVNPAAGQIQPLQGANGSRLIAAQLDNAGTIGITGSQGMTLNKTAAAHTNSGAINVTSGNLTVTQNSSGSFTNTGTISVPVGRILTVTGGAATLGDNLVTGVGSIDFNGVAVSFTPRATFPLITSDAATVFNGGTLTIGAGDQLTFVSSTISSNVSLSGMLTMRRTNSITGTFTNVAGSTLRAFGISSSGDLTIANGFANNGTIQLTDSTASYGASLAVTSGELSNPAGSFIQPLQGANGARTLAAQLNNAGTITIVATQGMALNKSGAGHTSSGAINVTSGNLTITQAAGGSFTNTGTVTVPASRILTVTGGAATLGDNLVTGVGSIDFNGVALSFTPRTSFPIITSDAATVFNGGTLTIGANEELTFVSSTISSNVSVNGRLTMRRTSSITGTFTNAVGSFLRAFGISSSGDLTIANGFTNNGTIQLTDSTASYGASLIVTNGTLTNPAAGSIIPQQGSNGVRTLAARLSNAGIITVGNTQGLTINKPGAAHTNSGTINVTTGNLTVTQSAGASFTTTGSITVPTGRTLTFTGGSATLGNNLVTGVGSIDFNGVAVSFTPRNSFPIITSDAATVFNGGTLTIGAGEELTFVSSTISSNVSVSGRLTMRRTSSITGTFTNAVGSFLRAFGISSSGDLTIANGFTNNGTIQLTDSTASYGASLIVTNGTLTNPAAGSIIPQQGSNGTRTLVAQLSNAGIITIGNTQGLTINKPGAVHTSSNTINLSAGNLTVTQSAGGSFTTTGSIVVPSGRTLTFTGGAATLGAALVTGLGSLDLNGVAVSFDPRSNFPIITSDAATVFNGGTLAIADTVDLTFLSSTISSNVALGGTLTMRRTNSITGTFSNTGGSLLRPFGISSSGDLTIANGFTNNGVIALTDSTASYGASLNVTTGTLVNGVAGQIQPLQGSNGTRTIGAALNNLGTVTIGGSQGLTLSKAGAAHFNSGSIFLTAGSLTITQGVGGSFTHSGSLAVPVSRTLTITGGSATLGNNLVTGVGSVVLSGVAVSFSPLSTFPVITSDAATVFNGGTLTIPSGQGLTFVSSTISSNVSLSGALTMRRTNSITGTFSNAPASTLRAMGLLSSGDLTIANGFTNNGSMHLTDSTASYGASLTVTAGTITNALSTGFLQPLPGSNGIRTLNANLLNQGTININNSQGLTINGQVTNQNSFTLGSGTPLTINGQLNNAGTFTIAGNQTVDISQAGAAHTNSGTISLPSITSGTLRIGPGAVVTQTFVNSGTISVGAGRTLSLHGNTAFTNAVGGTYTGPSGGTLNVAATSTFTNNGIIAPGGVGTAGTMNYVGVWNPGSGGQINSELASAVTYDRLAITGAATFGGTLNISALAGYTLPGAGSAHDIMTFTSQSGAFGTINRPAGCGSNPTVVTGTIYRFTC